jgi:hypothetical protein
MSSVWFARDILSEVAFLLPHFVCPLVGNHRAASLSGDVHYFSEFCLFSFWLEGLSWSGIQIPNYTILSVCDIITVCTISRFITLLYCYCVIVIIGGGGIGNTSESVTTAAAAPPSQKGAERFFFL